MRILVTGGAGYIGSITVKYLQKQGHEVVVFDNLVYGHKESVDCPLIVGDLTDRDFLFSSLENQKFDGVIHFAAYALVGDSMHDPYRYFYSNLAGGINLLELMLKNEVNNIIFSSSCSIFGTPKKLPVSEGDEKHPESVYAETKYMFERILDWYDKTKGIKSISLRYFNAAGAAIDGTLGEEHDPETHIIPNIIKAVKNESAFPLFGNDYDTADGSCIRDYIHVQDLAVVHLRALDRLIETGKSDQFNLGTGQGYSNLEVIKMVEKVTGKNIKIENKPRRVGDPSTVYADNAKAKNLLGLDPKYSDLETIIKTAWDWHSKK